MFGSAISGRLAEALRERAFVYDPTAEKSCISAEVFLSYKYLLMEACVGVFPEAHIDHVVGGLFAVCNERASGMDLGLERQQAMDETWQLRAGQLDRFFSQDQQQFLEQGTGAVRWKQTIGRFCRNVHEMVDPPNIEPGVDGPSHIADHSVTAALDEEVSALGEINRLQFDSYGLMIHLRAVALFALF